MALGIRAYFEAYAKEETKYRVRIWEEGFSGTPLQLETSREMFTISYQPAVNDLAATIAPSSAGIEFYVQGDDERTLISDIVEYQQTNFFVTIDQDIGDTGSYSSYWKGVVLQDQATEEDAFLGVFVLRCVDGLSRLKDIPFDFSNDVTDGDFSYTRVYKIIYNALSEALPLELWGNTDNFLGISVNWWCNDQSYSATSDPTIDHLFDVQALVQTTDKFNFSFFEYKTNFEVLEIFAKAYLARVYMANGTFYFEQITERRNANLKRNFYSKSAAALTSGLVSNTVAINQTREAARLAGNSFTRFAALKRVTVQQTPYNSIRPTSYFWNISSGSFPSSASLDFGLYGEFLEGTPVANFLKNSLKITIEYDFESEYTFSSGDAVLYYPGTYLYGIRDVIDIEIKLEDANSGTTYYFDGVSWQTTAQTITGLGGSDLEYRANTSSPPTLSTSLGVLGRRIQTINTAPLPATGRVTVTTDNYRTQKLTSVGPFGYTTISSGVTLTGNGIRVDFTTKYPTTNSVRFFNIENTNSNIADFEVADLGEMLIGDGALQSGHIFIEDAVGDYQPTTEWNYANESRDLSLAGLLTTERLGLQRSVIQRYNGRLFMPQGYDKNISFDSIRWMPLQYTFIAGPGIVNAEYVEIERFTVSEDYDQDLGADFENDLSDDDKQYKFGGITIGRGQVQDTYYDTDQILEINNHRTEQASRGNLVEVEMDPGSSDTLTSSAHIVFAKWSGGAGTFELTLPAIDTEIIGQQIEIVMDENFTASTEISVLPSGSDTIKGESSEIIAGGGDTHFFYRATSTGWY